MKDRKRCDTAATKTSNKRPRGRSETPMSTSKVSTSQERIDIRIPKTSKIYQYLYVDIKGAETPIWRRLDALLTQAEENSADQVTQIFEEFKARIRVFHPEAVHKIEKLRALILWHILWGEDLPVSYYEKLKEL